MKHRGWSAVRGGRKGAQLALGLGLVLLGTAALPLHAQDGADSASQQQTALRRVRLDIPAQPLNRALLRFAEQAGVQVFFDSQRFAGLGSAAVHGEYVLADGLSQMLQGSPVEYRFSGKDQLSLIRVSQDDLVQMSPSVISAARPDDWVYQTPHSVSVIGREQIERNPPRHAADMLEETPGVYSSVSQQDPGLSVNIRGIQDYGRVNMSVDGMRQNYQQSGHQQRNGTLYVDPELLSEVVIDKGASSAMGGAGVIGGIANFRTLEARDLVKPGKQVGGRVRLAAWAATPTAPTSSAVRPSPSAPRPGTCWSPPASATWATTIRGPRAASASCAPAPGSIPRPGSGSSIRRWPTPAT